MGSDRFWAGAFLPLIFFCARLQAFSAVESALVYSANPQAVEIVANQDSILADSDSLIQDIGFRGVWKLGHSCTVTVKIPESENPSSITQDGSDHPSVVEVKTVDGDAVEVSYRRILRPEDWEDGKFARDQKLAIPVRIGRIPSIITATLLDQNGGVLASQDIALSEKSGLSPTQPLVLTIGGLQGVTDLVRTSADGHEQSLSVVNVDFVNDLPTTALEYASVDLIVIAAANTQVLKQLAESHWTAIDDYILSGGACVISLGPSGDELRSFSHLVDWLPGELNDQGVVRNPAALESLVNTDQAIQPFPVTIWKASEGSTKLTLSDSLGKSTDWWVSIPHGFGTIQVIASDLGHESFAQWKHRRLLLERLVAPYFDKSDLESIATDKGSGGASYLGYSDLSGQLRATLERFQQLPVVTFSQIAAVIIGLVLLIGPADYFLSVRWLNRPHFSWFFATIILAISSFALVWAYYWLRPNQVLTNSATILDVDSRTGRTVGHQWSHIYSSQARLATAELKSEFTNAPIRLDWQGLPGSGLGGLQSTMRIERGMPAYQIELQPDGGSRIVDVGIPAAGTKSLYATWIEQLPIVASSTPNKNGEPPPADEKMDDATLREMATVDQLEGAVVNPLTVDLRDTAIFYHRWYYALKSRMPPGDRVMLSSQILPRDISRKLNKQQEIDGKLTTARWDPANRDDLDRLIELMMFHKASTGRNYTSLTHRYQPSIDHSNLLESSYAILVGRLESSPTRLLLESSADSQATADVSGLASSESSRNWVRILIPVTTRNSTAR